MPSYEPPIMSQEFSAPKTYLAILNFSRESHADSEIIKTREIVHGFLGLFGANPESHGVKVCSIIFAIIFVYVLDFAINTGEL